MRFLSIILIVFFTHSTSAKENLADCLNINDSLKRLNCYDTLFNRTKHKEASKDTNLYKGKNSFDEVNQFGSEKIKKSTDDTIQSISSRIKDDFKNWKKGMLLKLENGQKWRIIDGHSLFHKVSNPNITIQKGALGSYHLSFEDISRRLKITRVK